MGIVSTNRLRELDSLRGLAALTVILQHFKMLWIEEWMLGSSPHQKRVADFFFLPVTAGHEAVILFFVLSGFVLSIPAVDLRAQTYSVFVIRRVFRIYVPYLAALVLAVLGSMFFYGDVTKCRCFALFWSAPSDWHVFMQHVIFLGQYNTDRFNPPIWSLVHEMRISLIFPFLCALALKMKPGKSLLLALSISGASIIGINLIDSNSRYRSLFGTLHYAALFIFGIYLVRQSGHISELFGRLSIRIKIGIAVLSLLLYVYGGYFWLAAMQKVTSYEMDYSGDWWTAVGAAGFIVFALNSRICSRGLLWAPVQSLGKMSYSLYLLHATIIFISVHFLYEKTPLPIVFALCLAAIFAASSLFHRFVEVPSINLGRRLSSHF